MVSLINSPIKAKKEYDRNLGNNFNRLGCPSAFWR